MSHTPGPWIECAPEVGGVISENYRLITGGAECEAQADDTSQWGRECLRISGYISPANARLIAAAPDLLEALKELVAISDRKHDAWDKAHAAIAKATGGQ